MMTPCKTCGGAAHPATGCQYSETWIVCRRCTEEAWKWIKGHTASKGGRKMKGQSFYDYVRPIRVSGTYEPSPTGGRLTGDLDHAVYAMRRWMQTGMPDGPVTVTTDRDGRTTCSDGGVMDRHTFSWV